MPLPITAISATILTFIFTNISFAIIRQRRRATALATTSTTATFERLVYAHGNFAQFAPIALILLALLEMQGVEASLLIGLAALLIFGRATHASGILKSDRNPLRTVGFYATMLMLATSVFLFFSNIASS